MDTGTASKGMMDARHVCRKTITTNTTRAMASSSVITTAWMLDRTNWVGSYIIRLSSELGKSADNSSMTARTWSEMSSALEPGDRSEEHTSELQSLMRNSYAVFC